ncbi:MAG: hypothetical protein IT304_04730 [Dehalococcoidia bacterium]|nr:hypothetical protein [Dehalococcoidia bacterium]
MTGNAKARRYLEEILTGVRFGCQFAHKATDGKPDYWDGFAAAMRTVDEHATRLIRILDDQDAEEAAALVSNVINLAERRRTS